MGHIYRVWGTNETVFIKMAKVASVFAFMVLLAVVVEGRDWRFETVKRIKRGYNTGGFGSNSGTYGQSGQSDENASISRERLGCSGEQGGGGFDSGSRELAYNKDGRQSDNRRNRSFSKTSASASASATAFNQNLNHNLNDFKAL